MRLLAPAASGPKTDNRTWATLASADATRKDVEQLADMGWIARTQDGRVVLDTMTLTKLKGGHVYATGPDKAARRAANKRARASRKANR